MHLGYYPIAAAMLLSAVFMRHKQCSLISQKYEFKIKLDLGCSQNLHTSTFVHMRYNNKLCTHHVNNCML